MSLAKEQPGRELVDRLESSVRSYCRSFPTVFARAEGSFMYDVAGRRYLDFFAGAGALNYGHNPAFMRERLIEYISGCGIMHALDMTTVAKCDFLAAFERLVLVPRQLRYKVMFTGPTGTNAVEAALKLARKVTGRQNVVAFTNGYHGMTLGALAATGSRTARAGAGRTLDGVVRMPYDRYFGPAVDTIAQLAQLLDDPSSGVDPPAAFLVETVQAEGGVNVATADWLRRLVGLAQQHAALLIIDEVQVGCGRTGPFFSFEAAGITPDLVCLSKSISGCGLPMALTLIRPELDQWKPGEHNGTFRGNNLAFVTAGAALQQYWQDDALQRAVGAKAAQVNARLMVLAERYGGQARGCGLIQGLAFERAPGIARAAATEAFQRGLIIETSGSRGQVLKLLPALTIDEESLDSGLEIIEQAVRVACEG